MGRPKKDAIPSQTVRVYTFEERTSLDQGEDTPRNDCLVVRMAAADFQNFVTQATITQIGLLGGDVGSKMMELRFYGRMLG